MRRLHMKNLGVSLLLGGIILLIGFGIYQMLIDIAIPLFVKIAIILLIIGFLIIIFSLIKERINENKEGKK